MAVASAAESASNPTQPTARRRCADEQLEAQVTAAQQGCRFAFDDLVRATYADTYSLALKLTGNRDDAQDVAQDTYLRAFRHLRRFRGDASFLTWLYRITVNTSSTWLRRHRRNEVSLGLDGSGGVAHDDERAKTPEIADRVGDNDPEAAVVARDLERRITVAIGELPPKLRSVIVLRDVDGMAHDEIAAMLGISESAAKVRLHRARRRLHETVFGDESEAGPEVAESLPSGAMPSRSTQSPTRACAGRGPKGSNGSNGSRVSPDRLDAHDPIEGAA